jgi:UPF0755 protein
LTTPPRKLLLGAAGAALLVALVGGVWLARKIDPPGPPGATVSVPIQPGTSAAGIANRLQQQGILSSARVFRLYLKLTGEGSNFQAGEYELQENMAMGAVVHALKAGPKIRFYKLTLPEGLTLADIADRVGKVPGRDRTKFLDAARSGVVRSRFQPSGVKSLEGLLFPDTYLVTDKEDEAAILARLRDRFDQVASDLHVGDRPLPSGMTPYQVIVAASLVEAEAKVPEDRPLIAAVIANRLRLGMKLQIDATVLYALGEHKTRVLYSDLEVNSPYNTYKVDGLPPTPIAAPGKASLQAVLEPAKEDYLYYVLFDKNGKHAFASTAAEFERLKAEAQRKGVL